MGMVLAYFFIMFILFFFFVVHVSSSKYSTLGLLKEVLKVQEFSNIKTVYSNSNLEIIRADKSGENYLFGVRKDSKGFTSNNINGLYEYAQKAHIHTVVIATYSPIGTTSPIYRLIREYGIDVWDYNKLLNLCTEFDATSDTEYTASVLSTSDTSDDTCPQDSSFDPIQDVHPKTTSIFSGLFNKPDRL
ncbi:MAG: hypothetical protein IJW20_01385 [Clostridia bacterium]|nr:hypothetical protein [Clostridia bacterium]